ncbi:S-methyl-5-thioribose-1-phosphate isomerase [Arthrospira platensis BEA 1257B]
MEGVQQMIAGVGYDKLTISMETKVYPVIWHEDRVLLIDQTRLSHEYALVEIKRYEDMARAIATMIVRGAPAIGIAVAYGMYLGARDIQKSDRDGFLAELKGVAEILGNTRPTAVNLFWAIERMLKIARETSVSVSEIPQVLLAAAQQIQAEDLNTCQAIGDHGLAVLPKTPEQLNILTHCNTGSLATAGYGTALGVIRSCKAAQRLGRVYADETRPRLQGAKLTTWECVQDQIPVTLIADNMAAHCMKLGLIHAAIVGADRIAANGDTANKIGTYNVALVARAHNIPFFVAAPLSTVDFRLQSGEGIPIEERDPKEVYQIGSTAICPPGVEFYNPAFDVTPAELITAIITEHGAVAPGDLKNLMVHQC